VIHNQFANRSLPSSAGDLMLEQNDQTMRTRTLCMVILMAAVFITFLVLFGEPRYHGRKLTRWLQQYDYTPEPNDPQRRLEAKQAVQAIGAKRALPVLLRLVEAKDDPVSLWLINKSKKYSDRVAETFRLDSFEDWERTRWHSSEDFQQLGIAGFEILGTNAASAVPELAKLLNDNHYSFVAERCLDFMGKPAEPALCNALTNQDPGIRQWSMDELASVTDDVGVYIDRIKGGLKDSSDAVRTTAVDDIGIQNSAPELAVPLLVEALKDSSDSVRSHAAGSLANFGTNALPVFPILSNLVESGSAGTANAALTTLVTLAPERAFPILTNSLARGKPTTDDALRQLANVAPNQALPIILARLQSRDYKTRQKAFNLLLHYRATPGIESVMQTIALSSDVHLTPAAKRYLTDDYETNHPGDFLFPDDPSYNGKRLGTWLVTRNEGEADLTPAAKDAIRHLGTNAIPALLKRLAYMRPPYCFSPIQTNINAAGGFIVLGEQAMPAFPELERLMGSSNENVAISAMIATCGTGSNAIPFLIKGLTNQLPRVRSMAADTLAGSFNQRFPEQVKPAILLFVKLLNDPDDDVRMDATNQLKEIDPVAAAKAGIK
jgi:HEAT repeat protein